MRLLHGSLLLLATAASAQDATPAPQTAQAVQAAQSDLATAYTLRAGTQLVILDVTVKDKHGNKIHGLHQSDFVVKESGKPEVIANVEEHTAPTPAQIAAYPAPLQLPPGDYTNFISVPATGALNIILVDKVNTALKDQLYLREQLIDYLKHASPSARTAIYGLNNHLELLQGFTSDPKLLLAALDSKHGHSEQQRPARRHLRWAHHLCKFFRTGRFPVQRCRRLSDRRLRVRRPQ